MREHLGKIKWASVAGMTTRQKWWFLAQNHEIAVSTVDPDGVIFTGPTWYRTRDERLFITLDEASRHIENVRNGSKVTAALIRGGDELCTARGLTIQGHLKLNDGAEIGKWIAQEIADNVLGPDHPDYETYLEFREFYNHTSAEIVIDKIISWDSRNIYTFQTYSNRTFPTKELAGTSQRHQKPQVITHEDTAKLPRWEMSEGCNSYMRVTLEMQGCGTAVQGYTTMDAHMEPNRWKQSSWDEIFYTAKGVVKLEVQDAEGTVERLEAKEGETLFLPAGYTYTLVPPGTNSIFVWSSHPASHKGLKVMRDIGFATAPEVSAGLRELAKEARGLN